MRPIRTRERGVAGPLSRGAEPPGRRPSAASWPPTSHEGLSKLNAKDTHGTGSDGSEPHDPTPPPAPIFPGPTAPRLNVIRVERLVPKVVPRAQGCARRGTLAD